MVNASDSPSAKILSDMVACNMADASKVTLLSIMILKSLMATLLKSVISSTSKASNTLTNSLAII